MSLKDFEPIIAAAAVDGFKPKVTSEGVDLLGHVQVNKLKVPLCVRFTDPTLAEGPRLFVPDVTMLGREVVPHVDESDELCAVDRQTFVFDRYRAPELTRGLIKRAAEVLARGMTKAGTDEIAEEFPSYWSASTTLPALPLAEGFEGSRNEALVTSAAILSFAPHQARPATLGELIEWANHWDKSLGRKIIDALARLSAIDPTIVIAARNATVAATVKVSSRGEAFLKSLARPAGWSRFVGKNLACDLPIERSRRRDYDLATLFGTGCEGGRPPLAGRTIVLIGCGAIGGYLARLLIQLGAGVGGRLALIDKDILGFDNVRRHQLGLGDFLRGKATACAEMLRRDFPGVDVDPVADDVTKRSSVLSAADLVIDATGEQGVSEWLNQWALDRHAVEGSAPPLLFVWIAGLGSAVQSFLAAHDGFACYRCLRPDLLKPGRFEPLKEAPPEPVAGCGDQASASYGPAAPVAAASLAANHASDWARGHLHPRLRAVRIDWEATVKRDPKSPDRAADCPACGSQ